MVEPFLHLSLSLFILPYLMYSPYFLLIFWFGSTRVVRYAAEARSERSARQTQRFRASAVTAFQRFNHYSNTVQFFPLLALRPSEAGYKLQPSTTSLVNTHYTQFSILTLLARKLACLISYLRLPPFNPQKEWIKM